MIGLVDVGDLPGACEPTTIGYAPPAHLPAERPRCVLPDLDQALNHDLPPLEEQLSDLAANALANDDDLYVLTGSCRHVRAVCERLGAVELSLDLRNARVAELERQMLVAYSLGARALAKVEEATILLRTERARCTREVNAHTVTIESLTAANSEVFLSHRLLEVAERALAEAETLRVSALEDAAQQRALAISLSEQLVVTQHAMAGVAAAGHDRKVRAARSVAANTIARRPLPRFDTSDVDVIDMDAVSRVTGGGS